MIRNILLTLSENKFLTGFISRNMIMSHFARRFVAGESLPEAIKEIKRLNTDGVKVTIDHLGENVEDQQGAEEATHVYLDILETIKRERLDANVSTKLTQLGLDIGLELCRNNLFKIADKAKQLDNFVRIDMESSEYIDRTLDIFRSGFKEFANIGIVIQSYLYRSENDVEQINEINARVRICKGAYKEPKEIAFPRKKDVDENFLALTRILLKDGIYPAIATHDEKMIEGTRRIADELGVPPDTFEFQMLYGIRRDLQLRLVKEDFNVRVYTAYGDKWAPYFLRRLAERPANIFFILKNLMK